MPRRHASLPTSLGDLLVVGDDGGLVGLYFPEHWHPPTPESLGEAAAADDLAADPLFARLGVELDEYLAGRRIRFDLPLAPVGDDFQQGGVADAA